MTNPAITTTVAVPTPRRHKACPPWCVEEDHSMFGEHISAPTDIPGGLAWFAAGGARGSRVMLSVDPDQEMSVSETSELVSKLAAILTLVTS